MGLINGLDWMADGAKDIHSWDYWIVGESVCQWMSVDDPGTSIHGTIGLDWMVGESVCRWMSLDEPRTSIRGTNGWWDSQSVNGCLWMIQGHPSIHGTIGLDWMVGESVYVNGCPWMIQGHPFMGILDGGTVSVSMDVRG